MKQKLIIIFLLALTVGLSQNEYDLESLMYKDGIFLNKSDEASVNGSIYQIFGDQKFVLGLVVNGRKEGLWTFWYKNGRKREEGIFKEGKEVGVWKRWHDNGKMKSKRTIKFGKGEGLWTWWYYNGKKESKGTFKNGKKEGKWTFWYENGIKTKEGTFEEG